MNGQEHVTLDEEKGRHRALNRSFKERTSNGSQSIKEQVRRLLQCYPQCQAAERDGGFFTPYFCMVIQLSESIFLAV
jgi:hypothetical protein